MALKKRELLIYSNETIYRKTYYSLERRYLGNLSRVPKNRRCYQLPSTLPHCGFEKKAEELELFAAIVKLNCPNCGTLIEQRQGGLKETNEFRQVKCPKCNEEYLVKPQYESYRQPTPLPLTD